MRPSQILSKTSRTSRATTTVARLILETSSGARMVVLCLASRGHPKHSTVRRRTVQLFHTGRIYTTRCHLISHREEALTASNSYLMCSMVEARTSRFQKIRKTTIWKITLIKRRPQMNRTNSWTSETGQTPKVETTTSSIKLVLISLTKNRT